MNEHTLTEAWTPTGCGNGASQGRWTRTLKDGLVVTVRVSEGKTLASDGMEVCSDKDCVDGCAEGARDQGRMRQGKNKKMKVIWP